MLNSVTTSTDLIPVTAVLFCATQLCLAQPAGAAENLPQAQVSAEADADNHTDEKEEIRGPDWMVVVSPNLGWLRNVTTIPVPVGRDGDDNLVFDEFEITDNGFGGGITLMGYYKRFAMTNVLFGFPAINHADLMGSITYASFAIPTGVFLEPYIGAGFVAVYTDAFWSDFRDERIDDLGGIRLKGFAHIDTIGVKNTVLAPFPKVGLKFHVPIQHWYVQPFYSYMYEYVKTETKTTGGAVELWECARQDDPECGDITGDQPADIVTIRAFEKSSTKEYHSHLVGVDLFFDFNYFMQLRGKVYYNTNHNLWTVRLIGSLLFSKNMGVSAFFEHSQKNTVTNTYFLIGPAFVFSPPGFMDKMMERRKQKGKKK